jgi:SAM-dependent methyltransferase
MGGRMLHSEETGQMKCTCCGFDRIEEKHVLWPELIGAWGLTADETAYIDRQQGAHCVRCGANLRSMALARALMACLGESGILSDFVQGARAQSLRVLEINEAGRLTQFLNRLPNHVLVKYPQVDMMNLPFEEAAFDLVVHSDTLEHVPDPIRGLGQCRRVLDSGGFCAFTVPMLVGRLTASRRGLAPSYHGSPDNPEDCLVRTEYGADAWTHVMLAGFRECRIFSVDYPAAQALAAIK